ncbi:MULTISPECIES: flagellin [Rhizobium/Agrobacterium group]|jgi:flagellin|uniref:Flagellin n=2 Tax=Rhizobium/Agrobacterium group TaxID=227290 RepID=A0AA44F0L7_AGRTU|nr:MULTISPECIES: flagellin [Rhizobium/Agrobacterium group]QDG92250.1 flagellar protein FlaD [Rhizobium sp. NIBRBAC000502774]AYM09821.1 flagellin [Agrobacterium tumefaciens]AYM66411.1 flagellin [Agrobacterium tumefaciens]KAA3530870.1 flagellar protein FlaD [Agrobacterium tumefaciens]MDP9761093.1 flagellin [Agrobacterium tumefaciens]
MTSILTNAAAMAALQTLRMIDKNLETTQARVSSGYRVETAADNAAYWSISTTMRSDNAALSAVQDALGLGAAKVDTAYDALANSIEVVKKIKEKLVAAYGVGADRGKIQDEIKQLQEQLKSTSESASFSGENWLQASISNGGTPPVVEPITKKVVASFTRTGSGNVGVTTVDYVLDGSAVLFDLSGGKLGILDKSAVFVAKTEQQITQTSTTAGVTTNAGYVVKKLTDAEIGTLNAATPDTNADPSVYSNGTVNYLRLSENTWVKVTATNPSSGTTTVAAAYRDTGSNDWFYDTTGAPTSVARSLGLSVSTLDLDNLDVVAAAMSGFSGGTTNYTASDAIDVMMSFVDKQLEAMTSTASSLGSLQSRINMQENFVSSLMDVIDKGIGRLVDADMNEESTRLKALQTQQQLGIQALSIANANAQNILQLFK